ncbi:MULTISPECIES: hypothetical protein [Streptomyces]|uniref:HK97 gp10 family phage protein n=2 Tax=Streptomyces rimosus subsp. rimosus TaxID=132474 RepID=L8EUB3_STRR1|nr:MULTISPECIES: hypothetical protein [Streptomyces]KOG84147.1 hypothetical protein ADK78_00665 [Kitasatospora aureofaciens]MYT44945.1 hypothetical protein [Streptomyces sp. SID5471]KOT27961.1 hypothetical protein ADK84_37430 [Streptomyces sp. NRRL WC-3701]KOT42259.1 hypothetical protein ADK42_10195 [Streptomyces rimosus subsp. rimosus]KOT68557.1 hypothetical protein ADK44_00860 [Streptomyces rimosus subsp. rimosus]
MTADVRELQRTAVALRSAPARAEQQMTSIVTRGALSIKKTWAATAAATAGRHARHYPRSISYDVLPIPGGASAEIGPDKARKQGALGNLLEFGSVHNRPHNDGGRALAAEAPRFTAHVVALTLRAPWQ